MEFESIYEAYRLAMKDNARLRQELKQKDEELQRTTTLLVQGEQLRERLMFQMLIGGPST